MPYSRRLPRVAPTGRITLRLTTVQRDRFLASPQIPASLGHALHRAAVREGKLTLRATRAWLDALIAAAANVAPQDRRDERALETLLRYLEARADQFAEPEEQTADEAN